MKESSYTGKNNEYLRKEAGFSAEQLLQVMDGIPVCINLLNENADSVYCNAYTVDLYDLDSKETYMEKFYELTLETQPDGQNSKTGFKKHVASALEKGEVHFSWTDKKLTGEEIPLYISIYSLDVKDENGNRLLVSTMQDLRPYLAGEEEDIERDEFYYNRMTYKDLFKTVAELSEEWFWVYDTHKATIQFYGKGREILGLSAEKQPFPEYVVNSGMVYPDDLDVFLKFDENLKNGIVEPTEVRFTQQSGVSRYYRIIYKTMYDNQGKPMFSVGKTYDIDKQKKLEVLSKTDLLTNCLNKITTENNVKSIIENSPTASHALYIIDVDDFKSVNDEIGHYFGDLVLSDIAKNLHANFRGADIIGRIGGDEFLVFVKDISDERVIKSKAKAIAEAFNRIYTGPNKDYKVSGSVGVALYPMHASSYEGLYKCADKALYNSKSEGKDRYTIYSEKLAETSTKKLTAVENAQKPGNAFFDANITSAIFDVMYQAEDVSDSINMVIKMLGLHMNSDRCYIAQTFDSGASCSVTYEWVSKDTPPKKENFQNIDVMAIKSFFDELDQNGIMYNNNLNENSSKFDEENAEFYSANSYLLAQTKGKGHVGLMLGVDDNSKNRVWSEKEINTLQYVLKMISVFMASSQ